MKVKTTLKGNVKITLSSTQATMLYSILNNSEDVSRAYFEDLLMDKDEVEEFSSELFWMLDESGYSDGS